MKKKKLTVESSPVYKPLLDDLLTALRSGEIRPGDWLLGENALAREYGIGHISVRKALGYLEKEGYIKRMPGRGTQVLEKPEKLTEIIILCLKPYQTAKISENKFYMPIMNTIGSMADDRGLISKLLYHGWIENIDPADYWASEKFGRSTGLVLLGETYPEFIPPPDTIKGPAIQVDHRIPGLDIDSVEPDNFESGRIMAAHLAGLGHTRMVYFSWRKEEKFCPDRLRGVLAGIKEARIQGLASPPVQCSVGGRDSDRASGYSSMKRLLTKDVSFTGIIAYDPSIARGAVRALNEAGIRVPEDVSVVCTASSAPHNDSGRLLTHVYVDRNDVACTAFERLIWRFDNMEEPADDLKAPVRLVPGETTERV